VIEAGIALGVMGGTVMAMKKMALGKRGLVGWAKMSGSQMEKHAKGNYYGVFLRKLAKEGVYFKRYEPSANNPETKAWARRKRPRMKECFYNAQMFVMDHPGAEYYEGLCFTEFLPIDHAWVVYGGKVFDFTLEAGKEYDPETPEYLGLPIPLKFIATMMHETGTSGSVAPFYFGKPRKAKKKPGKKTAVTPQAKGKRQHGESEVHPD